MKKSIASKKFFQKKLRKKLFRVETENIFASL